mmetsp:Transcript_59795/g.141456  ORF Transcript_59795/g.141456 Transcript_59795/m.141456 type:complete len:207 (+) Transcript_59795:517-1137(+)
MVARVPCGGSRRAAIGPSARRRTRCRSTTTNSTSTPKRNTPERWIGASTVSRCSRRCRTVGNRSTTRPSAWRTSPSAPAPPRTTTRPARTPFTPARWGWGWTSSPSPTPRPTWRLKSTPRGTPAHDPYPTSLWPTSCRVLRCCTSTLGGHCASWRCLPTRSTRTSTTTGPWTGSRRSSPRTGSRPSAGATTRETRRWLRGGSATPG